MRLAREWLPCRSPRFLPRSTVDHGVISETRASAAFVGPLQDQIALELGDAAPLRQHQAAMWIRTVNPRIVERF